MFVVEEGNGESIMLPGQTGVNDVIARAAARQRVHLLTTLPPNG